MLLLVAAAIWFLLLSLDNLQGGSAAEGQRQLEESLYRATVSCYATEGRYPPTLAYLKERYGIQIDEERYRVFYEIFGDNLMPEITVLVNES